MVQVKDFLLPVQRSSVAFFCPWCGGVWARVRTLRSYWQAVNSGCAKHRTVADEHGTGLWPESTLWPFIGRFCEYPFQETDEGWQVLFKALAPDHLKYEFDKALEWAERELANG